MRHTRPQRVLTARSLTILALGVALVASWFNDRDGSAAEAAQNAQPARPAGVYTMVAANMAGRDEEAVFIVDVANGEMIVMTWDHSKKRFEGVGYRDLAADAARTGPPR